MTEHSQDFKSVVMLQICVGLIKDEPDSGSEAFVTSLDSGTEEGNIKFEESDTEVEAADIKVEESVDRKKENPEAIKFLPIKTEPEVSPWGLCVRQQQFMFHRPFTATKTNIQKYILSIFVCVLCILYNLFLNQPMHNIYINSKFPYHKFYYMFRCTGIILGRGGGPLFSNC
jgi:hypothetical protein